jgi:nucleotide-binding universal stress UspA family protein
MNETDQVYSPTRVDLEPQHTAVSYRSPRLTTTGSTRPKRSRRLASEQGSLEMGPEARTQGTVVTGRRVPDAPSMGLTEKGPVMTSHPAHEPVVVATDGTPAAFRGVRYAALEARRLGLTLEIVHVVPGYLPTGPLPMVPDGALQDFGRSVLKRSLVVAQHAAADVETNSKLISGKRVSSIVNAAQRAPLLVLGSRSLTLAARVWTGATVVGVCARARCPVVVVPEDWQVSATVTSLRIVVGFQSPEQAAPLLLDAFALANNTGAEVVVLHAWKLPSGYDDVIVSRVGAAAWKEQQVTKIYDAVSELRTSNPEVPVTVEVVHDRPAHALVEASRAADRLVLSRPVHGGYFHHLGSTARAVLREAHCPVEVLSPVAGREDPAASSRAHESIPT